MNTHAYVRIRRAEDNLRERGLAFIQKHYRLALGTTPRDEPDHLFVAYLDLELDEPPIVGTIGISLWKSDSIRLARIYEFNEETLLRPMIPETIFEYGRLVATRRGITKALIAVASSYALSIGRTYGWCEHTDAVHRICMSFGLQFTSVSATLKKEIIDDGDKEFYRRNPSVRLYVTDAHQWVQATEGSVCYENDIWSIC